MSLFAGTGVALITPFDEEKNIDENSLRNLIDYVIEGGVDYLVALGTTSEVPTLSNEEKKKVVEIIISQNKGRLPIVVGIGGNNTNDIIEQIKSFPYLDECHGILSVTPYYNKPSQEGLYQHFKAIADSSSLPIILYNVPGRTGVNMSSDTVCRLAKTCSNIVAIKEAGSDFQKISELVRDRREDFTVLSGDDCLTLPCLAVGAEGVISVIANLYPHLFASMVAKAREGDFAEARLIHSNLTALYKALFLEGNPSGIKAALYSKGIIKHNILRLPLVPVSDSLYTEINSLCQSI